MKHLEPLRTYLSPLLLARVRMPETSEPASGSVRQNEASERLLEERRRVLPLDLLGAAEHDRRGGEAVGAERRADARAAPGELLLDEAAVEVGEAGAAVLLGHVGVHEADLVGLVDDLLGPGAVPVVLPGDGADLLLGEVVGQLAQRSSARRSG